MTDAFLEHRSMLFGIAYRMLGSVAEAEDAVQEIYLRSQRQNSTEIKSPKAWLITATTRWCIDQLRSARRQREEYKGVWLPEPLVDAAAAAPDSTAAMADSLSMAFMLMLEQLSPIERAVFLLREAFDFDYPEIAAVVDKSEANCRQLMSRAKRTIGQTNSASASEPPLAKAEHVVQQFLQACVSGNLSELLALLTEDVVLYTDGGGRVPSALRPIRNSDRVARFMVGIRKRGAFNSVTQQVRVNGEPGVAMRRSDGSLSVTAFAIDGVRIRAIYMVNNPDKLLRLSHPTEKMEKSWPTEHTDKMR
jgi:RNA polymerase sigma-70 factor, ECF subfamily